MALGGQTEPSNRLALPAAGVGQVVALPLIAWVDSEGVASAGLPLQLLLRCLPCGVEVLALSVAVGAAALVGLSVHWGQVPLLAAVTLVWEELNPSLPLLVVS